MTPDKSFPVFSLLEVRGFGLFPGSDEGLEGLRIEFHPGVTLVVGANGLGKTTLVTLLFRLVSGPYDIPHLRAGEELGFRRLEASAIRQDRRTTFAARVSDRAATATARVDLKLGSTPVTVERQLSDLSLLAARVGGTDCSNEKTFQSLVAAAAGLGSFGDFILMLRYLVFYFEDRRELVWDASAQRQLLRMLFLPPDVAQRWTDMERSILQADSRMRNLRNVLGKEEQVLAHDLAKKTDAASLRAELQTLEGLQESDRLRLTELEASTADLDQRRQGARLAYLQAKQERETRLRALEHAQLLAIDARFPGQLAVGKYLLLHLLSENTCLVCGTHSPEAAQVYDHRLHSNRCLICDTPLPRSEGIVEAHDVAAKRVSRAERILKAADRARFASTRDREFAESDFDRHTTQIARLRSEIATRSARLAGVIELLPPTETALREQRGELASIRGRLEVMKSELAEARSGFRIFVERCTDDLLSSSEAVVDAFTGFARSFLSEQLSLTWTSRPATVGQGGEAIPFPAFEVHMAGSDFLGPVRRAGPDEVSESQREFIDLSFRMALMATAGPGGAALVVDTPESSLDAIFSKRAGQTLMKFGEHRDNIVLVTSNLVEGSLLPTLIAGMAATEEKGRRLIDLFEIAKPTATVVAEREEYAKLRRRMFGSL